jgi:hypothetical protein
LSAQDRAERWILGILLIEPRRWTQVQRVVDVTDFTDPVRRRLAEIYWQYQRDEGEPVFNEFLGLLRDSGAKPDPSSTPDEGAYAPTAGDLIGLAVDTVDEVEAMADAETTLAEALAHLENMRRTGEEQKLMAQLRRTSEGPADEKAEIDLLAKIQEKARQPNLRRA